MKSSTRRRRTHSPEFKAKLVAECQQPGASIAAIALAHQINDNLLRTWLHKSTGMKMPSPENSVNDITPRIIPVHLAPPVESVPFIRIHIQQGHTQIHLDWPLTNVAQCSEWLRGFLR